eukprot:INCI15974.1.p1 GENE.INCI15974.1~~INCI15974.1.p1  ORF type:complete len:420 (+),score=45.44 INCI15974.1:337-1596(+)
MATKSTRASSCVHHADRHWFNVFVKSPSRTLTVRVNPHAPLSDVYDAVRRKLGLSSQRQRRHFTLYYQGHALSHDRSAIVHNIQREATLTMSLCSHRAKADLTRWAMSDSIYHESLQNIIGMGDCDMLCSLLQQISDLKNPANDFIRTTSNYKSKLLQHTDFGRHCIDGATPIMLAAGGVGPGKSRSRVIPVLQTMLAWEKTRAQSGIALFVRHCKARHWIDERVLQYRLAPLLQSRGSFDSIPSVNVRHASSDETALMVAARLGHFEAVKLLLDAGAAPLMQDSEGLTAFDMASLRGNRRCAEQLHLASCSPVCSLRFAPCHSADMCLCRKKLEQKIQKQKRQSKTAEEPISLTNLDDTRISHHSNAASVPASTHRHNLKPTCSGAEADSLPFTSAHERCLKWLIRAKASIDGHPQGK